MNLSFFPYRLTFPRRAAEVTHRHRKALLEEVLEVVWVGVSAGGGYGVYLLACLPKAPLHFVKPSLCYRLKDASLLQLAEPEVGESARAAEVPHDIFNANSLKCMAVDVDDGLLHKTTSTRKLAG